MIVETAKTTRKGETSDQLELEGMNQIKIVTLAPFTLETPAGGITERGMTELESYLINNGFGCLPSDFEPVWCTKRGTLPKRVQNHLFKTYKTKLTVEQISAIGNIAKAHTSEGKSYIMDFTKRINWQDGDFGDGGSCFWGDKHEAKSMLEENAYAVRAFRFRTLGVTDLKYHNLRGYARAWLAPIGEQRFIVFNGYGETALTFARLLSMLWKRTYKKISLTNNGDDGGTLWINGQNYVIGTHEQIQAITHHDLGWDEPQRRRQCGMCEEYFDEDDGVGALNRYGYTETVCSDCAQHCEVCDYNYLYEVLYHPDRRRYECLTCRSKAEQKEVTQ